MIVPNSSGGDAVLTFSVVFGDYRTVPLRPDFVIDIAKPDFLPERNSYF